jgi:hypothetical protein
LATELEDILRWLSAHKDALQSLSWLIASLGGVAAAVWALVQFRETRSWKKTELARNILEEIWADEKCQAAMVLVDYTNREFMISPNTKVLRITRDEVLNALRTDSAHLSFSRKEIFIRDCFDNILDALQRLEHYIETKLIAFGDVEYPLEYTVAELSGIRPAIDTYIEAYDFKHAKAFLKRYDFWKRRENRGRQPCVALD